MKDLIPKVICENCGTPIKNKWKFCSNCGAAAPVVEKQPKIQKCPRCDSVIKNNMKFCVECGYNANLIAPPLKTPIAPPPVNTPIAPPTYSLTQEPVENPVQNEIKYAPPVQTVSQDNTSPIYYEKKVWFQADYKKEAGIILILGLMLVVAGAVISMVMFNLIFSFVLWGFGMFFAVAGAIKFMPALAIDLNSLVASELKPRIKSRANKK